MLRRKSRVNIPERLNPGDPEPLRGSPGSIEQQLDMCEEGDLRGDEILHRHGLDVPEQDDELLLVDERTGRFQILSEPDREDDEMTGDDHSSGLQGGEFEVEDQYHIDSGAPGNELEKEDELSRIMARRQDEIAS